MQIAEVKCPHGVEWHSCCLSMICIIDHRCNYYCSNTYDGDPNGGHYLHLPLGSIALIFVETLGSSASPEERVESVETAS